MAKVSFVLGFVFFGGVLGLRVQGFGWGRGVKILGRWSFGIAGVSGLIYSLPSPYPQRTHILRLLGQKTLLYKGFGLF